MEPAERQAQAAKTGRQRSRVASVEPTERQEQAAKKTLSNYFPALTYDPVRENKKLNTFHVACCAWSSSRLVLSKLVSTSRLVETSFERTIRLLDHAQHAT